MLHFCVTCGTFSTSHQLLRMNQARLIEFPDLLTMTNFTTRWRLRQFLVYIIENICSKPYFLHTLLTKTYWFFMICPCSFSTLTYCSRLKLTKLVYNYQISISFIRLGNWATLEPFSKCVLCVRQQFSCQRPDNRKKSMVFPTLQQVTEHWKCH